uniref:Activating transcription factor 7 interacting protein 2 n=1 Tax=Pelodiscus sinensis TaxID=13735 RepID=K7F6D4_PELSI|nr:activating transcription factor 7-interacting protein 2 [Pelodiscus sinensis]XP_014437036.1 activating transcription factor 7-interacting protein 2 [Pelodiscus sinensis]XP_014437038.1 activating transcription factor 7-interacting protein 2 [Pelodiscus sinensis]XP_025035278.1 activating transcription factor 7-interacting protein 2 [Pelodiscus sinensis]XP_025035279.1 activating transcription factor 7-interacting protein 2 [Pelodiscus sinensis]XP_025035280.1 activating transcription factor 7-i|eukprot:XP_006139186.1 activating transcription factor 7-interacting protein 2 [Pelodiscus sinensis]
MENSNTILPKPLRARKTMTPSSRKQVEMLNKIKNISGQEKNLNGFNTKDYHVQLNTVDVNHKRNDSVKESSLSESKTDTFPEKSEMLPQKLTASIQGFTVNSKVNEEIKQCSDNKNVDQNCKEESQETPHEKSCNKNSDAKQFLNAGCLQDILHKWYENELNTPSSKPVEVHLYSKQNTVPVDQLADSACLEDPVNGDNGNEKRNNMIIPILEKIDTTAERNSAIDEVIPTLKKVDTISDSNDVKHIYNLTHSVTPKLPGTDETADGFVRETADGNGSPNISPTAEAAIMLQDASPENSIDNAQRKRVCSEGKEDRHCKRIRTSYENKENICVVSEEEEMFWGKVKCLIQKRVDILNNDVFNQKLECLNGRVEQTQCRKKHEEIAITFLKKVSKLERRINTVIAFQKKILSKMVASKSNFPGANSQNTILNRTKSASALPKNVNGQSVSSVKPLSSSCRQTGSTTECVAEENVSSDEVILISVESRNSTTVTTANNSDVQKTIVSTQEVSTKAQSKNKHAEELTKSPVIDLTEEGKVKEDQNSVSHKRNSKPRGTKSDCHEPLAQASNMFLEHLPPLPRIPPYLELKDRFKDTVPPQKPELKLAQVQNPKGIALSWTVTEIDPKCAPVESYHLFLYHEHPNNSTASHWKKIGEIKALPLPMACSLSQFTASKKYYFTIQSKDVCGRYGPFCDIQSISLISLENS